jgi:Asp-tRNA(Asn)/Glu-tRNA(Gln) amidotransferase A subunit family amidase
MPIGLQLAGRFFDEPKILSAGYILEQALDLTGKTPCL